MLHETEHLHPNVADFKSPTIHGTGVDLLLAIMIIISQINEISTSSGEICRIQEVCWLMLSEG